MASNRTPPVHRHLDDLAGALLLFQAVWAPWAFGCTTHWAVWVLNVSGYLSLLALAGKALVRRRTGFTPERWSLPGRPAAIRLLGVLTVLFLGYVLVSALNARAVVEIEEGGPRFTYRDTFVGWLPHSYDARATWRGFWRYLGLAGLFWGARDWLVGRSRRERRLEPDDRTAGVFPTDRVRLLLWVWVLSSALLALVSILQRLEGTEKLLWLIQPPVKAWGPFSFGPFAYRANGAQYFNLLWPVTLGFWWALHERYRLQVGLRVRAGGDPSLILLVLGGLMAACPVVTTSRGGALLLIAEGLAMVVLLSVALRRAGKVMRRTMAGALVVGVVAGAALGGRELVQRFETVLTDNLSGRPVIYGTARRMAADHPVFGTGAETFPSLSALYRPDPGGKWEAYVHDDWLETRVSFGWVGFGLIVSMLAAAVLAGLTGTGLPASPIFVASAGVGMTGLLAHASLDFPFQVVGLLTSFLVLAALFSCLRLSPGPPRGDPPGGPTGP